MAKLLKRTLDILVSGLLLLIFFPFIIMISLLIYFTSGSPIFFRSVCVGKDGDQIFLYKFRTMIQVNEHQYLTKLMTGKLGPSKGNISLKMRNDPRITGIGRFLRKYMLDELPQLINVFHGEMSIVGPRPALPYEVDHYLAWQKERLTVKPGLTGLAQVLIRDKWNFEEIMTLDIKYIREWSLFLDFKILYKTVYKILSGRGAY